LTLIASILFCSSLLNAQSFTPNQLKIKQGNKIVTINNTDQTISLKREQFSIQFLNQPYQEKKGLFYAARALVTDSKINLDLERKLIDEIPYFEPGTGFEAEQNQLIHHPILSADGHQYLYYVSNKDKRVEKVGTAATWDIYQWNLEGVNQYDNDMDWNTYDNDEVNILFIVDRNLNGQLEKGEFHNLRIILQ